ncbi:MAG TPA: cytochrome c [Candidatus Sulfomarinibacteraceae bacterium]|nr:cytochrome c [Candidatus Sulfomarinibacteraceae bacterium]
MSSQATARTVTCGLSAGRTRLLALLLLGLGLLLAAGCASSAAAPPQPTETVDPVVAQGRRLFSQHCASCHAVDGEAVIVGPSLDGIASRAETRVEGLDARQYLDQSIVQPGAFLVPGFDDVMPSTLGKQLSGEELDALIAYLLTLQ